MRDIINILIKILFISVAFAFPAKGYSESETNQALEEIEEELDNINERISNMEPKDRKILFTGNIRVGYVDREGSPSTFELILRFHPYWKINDNMLCKADTQFSLLNSREGEDTNVFLFFGLCAFVINDYLNVKIGRFLTPFGFFQEYVHVEWMQKFGDEALPSGDDVLIPSTEVGVAFKGGFALGIPKVNYSLFVSNGPRLLTPENLPPEERADVGMVRYDNHVDNNENKAVGGRFGFLPIPPVEMGYSFYNARVGDKGSRYSDIDMSITGIDLNYVDVINPILGKFDFRSEYIVNKVDAIDYGQGSYNNTRKGYYWHVAYRPSLLQAKHLRRTEFLVRYGELDFPEETALLDMNRWTYAINYHLNASTVFKAAYQYAVISHRENSGQNLHGIPGQRRGELREDSAGTQVSYLLHL